MSYYDENLDNRKAQREALIMSLKSGSTEALIHELGALADGLIITEECLMAPFMQDMTGRWPGRSVAVARPRNTVEVAAIVRAASASGLGVVPQGGNTGLTGGSAGDPNEPTILLSLSRLRAIRAIEPDTPAVIAEAGCLLAEVQAAVAGSDLQIPLGLGSEGSASIGGLVSTNAGGTRALRHGVMRAQILGLEVVLPDGRIWHGLRTVLKNNMGYDLKQLFIGAEGTLGIVTAAAVRLVPTWRRIETAIVGVSSPGAALTLLNRLRHEMGDLVVACELMQHWGVELALNAIAGTRLPLADEHPWYVLVEVATSGIGAGLRNDFEQALAGMLEGAVILDAAIAESEAQRLAMWRLREGLVDGKRRAGLGVNVDVAVPLGAVASFIEQASQRAMSVAPGCRSLAFGHVGDGNVHYSIHHPEDGSELPLDALTAAIHETALALGGSICAEHGVGRKMRDAVAGAVDPVENALFATIKHALDPQNHCNPGAVVAAS
ncbi:FAD-binding oxidoreductase [Sphingomonas sp. So64.6b]|uniref:FAD-binding oxidoreductase n=1 Tax=Sphingomonas sp. So64.6b TaxID=2997354 RepID=UPI0015FFE427|nr:FAD-binding oxidoreductase [Sphingomonas sp. So64.6b]QNA85493.1 FAD-binding oxidoreductase [Sphingomonas sp. So64.6b]